MKLERAVIEVFGGCNYSCGMCPQSQGRGSDFTKKMPLDLFENILDQLSPKYGFPVINLEGSGEPTLAKDLPLYVEACTRRNLPSFMYCNGSRMKGQFMKDVIDAGLDFVRFSFIGYTPELYRKWMSKDNYHLIIDNAIQTKKYIESSSSKCQVSSYHLVLDSEQKNYEIEQYKNAFIDPVGSIGYIWMMHNWSGNYEPDYMRAGPSRKTCGRPFAPEITVRAGGLDGKHGAVTPCCQTMGQPNESKSVLGHFDDQSFEEIFYGEPYEDLRQAHRKKEFDRIDYCKNCDFLIENPEVLVWSNDPNATVDHMLGTQFTLADFKTNQ
jgi:MoaA/NifB/PqqE/SkfB family radical SAM enzyme